MKVGTFLVVATALGCGSASETEIAPPAGATTHVQMLDAGAASSAHDFVIAMVDMVDPTGLECDAVLLAPNLLVTARHCVASVDDTNLTTCTANGITEKTPSLHGDFDTKNFSFYADGLLTQPFSVHAAQILDDGAPVLCGEDIAFVVLDGPIDGVATASLGSTADTFAVGDALTVVGWGATDPSGNGGDSKALLERGDMNIVSIGPKTISTNEALFQGEFATSIGFCNGDSGGPAVNANGNVIGIVSRVVHDCATGPDIFTSTAAHFDLAAKAYGAAGVPFSTDPPALDAGPAASKPPDSGASSGCATAPSKSSRSDSWLFFAFAALAVVRKRRRKRGEKTNPLFGARSGPISRPL